MSTKIPGDRADTVVHHIEINSFTVLASRMERKFLHIEAKLLAARAAEIIEWFVFPHYGFPEVNALRWRRRREVSNHWRPSSKYILVTTLYPTVATPLVSHPTQLFHVLLVCVATTIVEGSIEEEPGHTLIVDEEEIVTVGDEET
ncbi:hypothetical protein CBL_07908 [Carabus blaptoides fortunei]